jgi:hypothetical protein
MYLGHLRSNPNPSPNPNLIYQIQIKSKPYLSNPNPNPNLTYQIQTRFQTLSTKSKPDSKPNPNLKPNPNHEITNTKALGLLHPYWESDKNLGNTKSTVAPLGKNSYSFSLLWFM